jgi:cytochrome c5
MALAQTGLSGYTLATILWACRPSLDAQVLGRIRKGNIVSEEMNDGEVFKMLGIVVGALTGFFVLIIILAQLVSGPSSEDAGVDPMIESATVDRIKPMGEVNIGTAPVAAPAGAVDAKSAYTASCFACHGTGAAGAPKMGDKGEWKKRIALGMDTLFDHAINGFQGMPPKGGSSLSDDAVKAVVEYMVKGSK